METQKRHILGCFAGGEVLQAGEIARSLGVTRQTAHRHLSELVADGRLLVEGAGRGTCYRLRERTDRRRFPTPGLEEDRVWSVMSGPGTVAGELPKAAMRVLQYMLTGLVNNVIDHSGAPEAGVQIVRKDDTVELTVRDGGAGIFRHIRNVLGLGSELEALRELSEGKTTTLPSRHTGEGIRCCSKAAQRFEIESGSLRWLVDNRTQAMAVGSIDAAVFGTAVRAEIDVESPCDLTKIFAEDPGDLEFSRTRTVVRLSAIGSDFVSRSAARRLVRGLESFREVVLDFEGVDVVGHGFADEVLRVWAREHPDVRIIPVGMSEPVAFVVERAIRAGSTAG